MRKVLKILIVVVLFSFSSGFAAEHTIHKSKVRLAAKIEEDPLAMKIIAYGWEEVLIMMFPVSFTAVKDQKPYQLISWWNWTKGDVEPWTHVDKLVEIRLSGDRSEVYLGTDENGPAMVRITSPPYAGIGVSHIKIEVLDRTDVNRIKVRFEIDEDDLFYGMGARFNSAEHRGDKVRVWAEEGGEGVDGVAVSDGTMATIRWAFLLAYQPTESTRIVPPPPVCKGCKRCGPTRSNSNARWTGSESA